MGGHQAGEIASRLAVKEVSKFIMKLQSDANKENLIAAIQVANAVIHHRGRDDPSHYDMGTTVVVAVVAGQRLLVAHVGDSRAYLLRSKELTRLTDDHTVVFELYKSGQISTMEAREHPGRGALLRGLGVYPTVEVDYREEHYNGEQLLLCTDGLTDMLSDEQIERVLRSTNEPHKACEKLVQLANAAGGRDNITVVVARGVNA
jgi:protein phosphatase